MPTKAASLRTRLTDRLGIRLPILGAPMGATAGGKLAAAVTEAGGLGLIAGMGAPWDKNETWVDAQFSIAGNTRVGMGFITWRLAMLPHFLDKALAHAPVAMMLSFGDPMPFAGPIKRAGVPLICQIQSLEFARRALDVGADILVAQGGEAGGHGSHKRATLTLVPETADLLNRVSPSTLLVAAGGIADGRGLAAALMLGADGVLMGSRLFASAECLARDDNKQAIIDADGDGTIRSHLPDIAVGPGWPEEYTARVLRNDFTDRWHGREEALRAQVDTVRPALLAASAARNLREALVYTGEAVGLIHSAPPVASILEPIATQAQQLLFGHGWQRVDGSSGAVERP